MKHLNEKLELLKAKIDSRSPITVMIIGLGSVGIYLLDYLVSLGDPLMHIVVAGRNEEQMTKDVNIIRTAAAIRGCLHSKITINGGCDLENIDSIVGTIVKNNPDFIVNSSRVYSGLKYGSISWPNLRAYGIWTPLSIRYARNIMEAYEQAQSHAITINTSYSDAVIPWLKSAGKAYFDFGSGNLNHLLPRMKFYLADKYKIENINDIDITMAVSHFHDVVISKEGHTEGQDILLDIRYKGEKLEFDQSELLKACMIPMPVDQKRNMMNASSNFFIIISILNALRNKKKIRIHSPGVNGEIGGYPYIIDGEKEPISSYFDENVFTMDQMRMSNRSSLALDGVENVQDGNLIYTDNLISKVKDVFGVNLPKIIHFNEIDRIGAFIVEQIIQKKL